MKKIIMFAKVNWNIHLVLNIGLYSLFHMLYERNVKLTDNKSCYIECYLANTLIGIELYPSEFDDCITLQLSCLFISVSISLYSENLV